jgi:AcrR family transcriptional regulator
MNTNPNDLRVVKTRNAMREAFVGLLSEKKLSEITISELCSRAMINRKTFYRHYRALSDIVTELENEILDDFSSVLRSSNSSLLDAGAVLRGISAQIERRRDFFMKVTPHNPNLFNAGRIKASLRRAMAVSLKNSGAVTDENVLAAVSEFTVSGLLALYSDWLDGGCNGSLEFISDISAKMVTDGMRAFVSEEKISAFYMK